MKIQTAERVSSTDHSDNYVFQRSLLAYIKAAELISGDVLEIGTGSGYGIEVVAPKAKTFTTIDKHEVDLSGLNIDTGGTPIERIKMTVPPLAGIADDSFDFVITFQVIEHIDDDDRFVEEIHRVLKPGGKLIVTTPNRPMSLTRNPWHVREYTVAELDTLLKSHFASVQTDGLFGGEKAMAYYAKNKESVQKIVKYDFLNLQYRLPRQLLQIPYDLLNRMNRRKLADGNTGLVNEITTEDFYVTAAKDDCLDLFYIAEKG